MAGKGQADGCCTSCAKWLLIVFNVLFCLLGVGLIAVGAYTFVVFGKYLDNTNINIPGIVIIVLGCLTFIIAALGCIGACKESPCLLFTFAVIVGILLVAEIVVGAIAFTLQDQAEEQVDKAMEALFNNLEDKATQETVNEIQQALGCCGYDGPGDWLTTAITRPKSCIDPKTELPFVKGCKVRMQEFVKSNIVIVGGVTIGFAVIELLGVVFACCVGCAARKGEYA